MRAEWVGGVTLLVLAGSSGAKVHKEGGRPMNEQIDLYRWLRDDAVSVELGNITRLQVEPGRPGQELVRLEVHVDESLSGGSQPLRSFLVERPVSETARLKFPDPTWGRVTLREGATILVVTSRDQPQPTYVDEVRSPEDPVLAGIRAVTDKERHRVDGSTRRALYLKWTAETATIPRRFAVEALAGDRLPDIDPHGDVALAVATAFSDERDDYGRLTVGEAMWKGIHPRTSASGQAAILVATLRAAHHASPLVRSFIADHVSTLEPASLRARGVHASPEAVDILEARLAEEQEAELRSHLRHVIEALRHPPP
jgi:hypothetical protein